jgi:tetratricopeptide (TPR) repeat protein
MERKKQEIHTLIQNRKFEEALAMLVELFEKQDVDAEVHYLLGTCFYAKEDISNAVRFLKKASDLEPDSIEYLLSLGMAYEAFSKYEKAFDVYVKMIKLNGEVSYAVERMAHIFKSVCNESQADSCQV